MRAQGAAIASILIILLSSSVNAHPGESFAEQMPVLLSSLIMCSILVVAYVLHIFVVYKKNAGLMDDKNHSGERYLKYQSRGYFDPTRWTFLLAIFALPLGISLVSRIFHSDNAVDAADHLFLLLPSLAYNFSISVFIITITLEISYIHNILVNEWQSMLIGALSIDIVSFLFYSLIGNPSPYYTSTGYFAPDFALFSSVFLFLTGLTSFISTFLTLY